MNSRKLKLVRTFAAIVGLLISSAMFILYSHKYKYIYQYAPVIGLIISGTGLIVLWGDDKRLKSKWQQFVFGVAFFLITLSAYAVVTTLRTMYRKNQLNKYGAETRGIVIDVESHTSLRGRTSYYAIVKYTFNAHTYWQDILDNQHLYKYGDSLLLKCSSQDPEMIEVISHTSGLKTE